MARALRRPRRMRVTRSGPDSRRDRGAPRIAALDGRRAAARVSLVWLLVSALLLPASALASETPLDDEAAIQAYLLDNGWPAPQEIPPALDPATPLRNEPLDRIPLDGGDEFVESPISPLPALPGWAQPAPIVRPAPLAIDEFVLQDVVDVVVIDRRILAFDARGTGQFGIELELGEQVLSTAALGRIGIAITDRRVLGVTADTFSWRALRFLIDEAPLYDVALGQQVALLVTSRRAIAFDGGAGAWLATDFGPREKIERVRVGPSTGLIVTNRRALGVSPQSGGFFETDLELRERLEEVTAGVGVATIITSRRILVFRGLSGIWTFQRRRIN